MNWQKTNGQHEELYIGSKLIASLQHTNAYTTMATVNGDTYTIKSTGFWTPSTTISSERSGTILTTKAQKWYSGKYTVMLAGAEYLLYTRNNPLCEFVLQSGDSVVLAYGLETSGQGVTLRISGTNDVPVWLHLLLWHLSWAMRTENNADTLLLLTV
jgi:hypothetical protein